MTEVTPEVRNHLRDHMAHTCSGWLDELMRGYFDDPRSNFARQLTLEAMAKALVGMVKAPPARLAVLETHILELTDYLKEAQQ